MAYDSLPCLVPGRVPDLDSLALLRDVADEGSLGRAAARHGISQPSASARIHALERRVGFPVLVRTPRGSTLTPDGALLVAWAREVLDAAVALEAGIASLREDHHGRLRVAASLTIAEYLLPGWLVRLAQERPTTTVRLRALGSAEVCAAVLAGSADLGFVEGPDVPIRLDRRVIGVDRLAVVVPPGHPWCSRSTPLDAAELAATRLVQREPASGTRAALEVALSSVAPTVEPLLELSTTAAVRAAVVAGAGPAVLSELAVRDDVAAGRLVRVDVDGVDLTRRLRVVWPEGQRLTGPALDLVRLATARG